MPPQTTSFIPKSGVKTVQRTKTGRRVYLLAYLSYIIFFSTLFAVIGVYLYGASVSRSLASVTNELTTEQQRFSVTDIDTVKLLDLRLATAERLLAESSAPSRLFGDIESIVASNIYFSGMVYEQLANRQFQINLIGRADNFSEIVGQRELLGNSSLLQNATVVDYDYSVGEEAGVSILGSATLSFIFSDTRDLSAIAYTPAAETMSDVSEEMVGDETVPTEDEPTTVDTLEDTDEPTDGTSNAGAGAAGTSTDPGEVN
jgi:hypothetical protein